MNLIQIDPVTGKVTIEISGCSVGLNGNELTLIRQVDLPEEGVTAADQLAKLKADSEAHQNTLTAHLPLEGLEEDRARMLKELVDKQLSLADLQKALRDTTHNYERCLYENGAERMAKLFARRLEDRMNELGLIKSDLMRRGDPKAKLTAQNVGKVLSGDWRGVRWEVLKDVWRILYAGVTYEQARDAYELPRNGEGNSDDG